MMVLFARVSPRSRIPVLTCLLVFLAAGALAAADLECLSREFFLEREIDLAGIGFDSGVDATLTQGDILDYFLGANRVVRLARWPAGPDAIERAGKMMGDTYELWVFDPVALPENPAWSENPLDNRNWVYHLHSLDLLNTLADSYRETHHRPYLERALELTLDYVRDNCNRSKLPSPLSWNDHTAANRMIYLTDAWPLFVESGLASRHVASRLLEFVWRHGHFLASENNYADWSNHGIFSSIALFRIASAFPEFRASAGWKSLAIERMEKQFENNVSSGGVHLEFSPWYQIWTAAAVSKYIEDCRLTGTPVSRAFVEKNSLLCSAANHFIHPDGRISLAGDSEIEPTEILMEEFLAGNAPSRRGGTFTCGETGIHVARSDRRRCVRPERESCLMAFFSGPARNHDHADPMNVEFYGRGQKWLTDAGRYAYESHSPKRQFVISQRAHNTVVPYTMRYRHGGRSSPPVARAGGERSGTIERLRSLEDAKDAALMERVDEFMRNFGSLATGIEAEGSDGDANVDILIDAIENLEDDALGIAVLERLEGISSGALRERIALTRAVACMETGRTGMMRGILRKLARSAGTAEYRELAIQLLATAEETAPPPQNGPGAREKYAPAPAESAPNREPPPESPETREESPALVEYAPIPPDDDRTHVTADLAGDDFDYIEGLVKYKNSFTHSRAVLFVKPHYLMIVDRIVNRSAQVMADQIFHFPPEVILEEDANGDYVLNAGDSLHCRMIRCMAPAGMTSAIVRGQEQPHYQGWYSDRYDGFVSAPALVNTVDGLDGTCYIAYLFVPAGPRKPSRTRVRCSVPDGWNGIGDRPLRVSIDDPGYRTVFSFMPSEGFILGSTEPAGEPRIRVTQWKQ